ncbi:hypothetical protein CW705_03960 [Candidatus Bathyarchaeota archaeon]|nr:MAG: hypothetical protein CW705_03960 [Candidatus Bathyarchaeota archaeon]
MTKKIGDIVMQSELFEPQTLLIRFDRADKTKIIRLIRKNSDVMIPFFVMICGFSVRELERLYNIKNVYSLRANVSEQEKLAAFAEAVEDNLKHPIHLETALYKFYKNWEEHQKRHYRGRKSENFVIETLRLHKYPARKIKVQCRGKEREIDCAIPPDPQNLRVAIMIRRGVFRDLVKRAKEYSTEFDELVECFPDIKFVVIYFISPHEKNKMDKVRSKIESEREGRRPYDLIILTPSEVNSVLLKKLEEWKIPKI